MTGQSLRPLAPLFSLYMAAYAQRPLVPQNEGQYRAP